ncbi:hypothetical protein K458DRAFT_391531 [Lentithecium fluviatile CBS 122367]|uniref:Uncharacterized protein n=1 Tax=Lentithecium fluviatile CBS 122367 TaxID=1168545 RepID=A0A6G1ITK8_9PLEO|nr:hypothetical protein K458DRAFT_391531 [Lentithecium fluviatile CBS 122367]
MVYLKGLLFATSFLLSGVAATPFPTDKRSAAAPDVQAVKGFSVESRGLHDVFAADIEDASKDKRMIAPLSTRPSPQQFIPPPRLGGDEPAPGGARPDAEGPLPGAKLRQTISVVFKMIATA